MSMEITNNYNNYSSYTDTAKKTGNDKAESNTAASTKDTAGKSVSDYYSYLQKNYDSLSQGNVNISSQYLKECAGNAAKAKELEDFLEKIPDLEKQGYEDLCARNKALGGTVTYYQQSWTVGKDGSIQSTVYSVTETGETNAEKLKRQIEERLEKQKEKKEEAEKAEEAKEKKADQEKKLQRNDAVTDVKTVEGIKQPIEIKYVEAGSEKEAVAMQSKEKAEDAYRPTIDVSV